MSDIARVYPSGQEPAKGGQDLSKPYPNGKELGHTGNGDKGHNYGDLAK
jgi:hypothetical protein